MQDTGTDNRSGDQRKKKFSQTVKDDLSRGDLRRTFGQEYRELKEFFIDEESQAKLSKMNWFSRAFYFVLWLMKSLYYKLTPLRRILLLISLILFILNDVAFEFGRVEVKSNLGLYSYLILLFVLMLELKDKLLAHEELAEGRGVQSALLPKDNPAIPGWEAWLYTESANEVGGDLVDYIQLSERKWGVALGDVAGKGLGAALFMAKLQATLRALAPDSGSLAGLGDKMNRILCRDGIPNRFASLLYLDLTPGSGTVRFLNAGHFPPVVLKRDGTIHHTEPLSMALGVTPDSRYQEQSVELATNDLLVCYSDGLTEAANQAGDFYGEKRVFSLLSSLRSPSAADTGRIILDAVKRFVGDAPVSDDLSLVVLRKIT